METFAFIGWVSVSSHWNLWQSWLFNLHLHTNQRFLKSYKFLMAVLCWITEDDVENIAPIKQMLPNPFSSYSFKCMLCFCRSLSFPRMLKNHSKLVRDEVRTSQPWVAMHVQACFWETSQPPHRTREWPTGYLHIYQLPCRETRKVKFIVIFLINQVTFGRKSFSPQLVNI